MKLLTTSFWSAVSVLVKLGTSVLLNKMLAVFIGPSGYAVMAQFQNAASVILGFTTGAISNGITKSTAEHHDNAERQYAVWKTALRFSLVTSLVSGLVVALLREPLSAWLFQQRELSLALLLLAATLPAMALNTLLLAALNGKKQISVLAGANIASSLINLATTGSLAAVFGLKGALIAFALNPILALLATAVLSGRCKWFKLKNFWGKSCATAKRELSVFGLMGMTSALTLPISYLLIRDGLSDRLGLEAAGHWQAMSGLSGIFLMLITNTLSTYYLPRLAEIKTATELKNEVLRLYRFSVPIAIAGALTIYLARDFIIRLLFTSEFLPMRDMFGWQLAGDFMKIGSWIMGYMLVGRAMARMFIITEIAFAALLIILSYTFIDYFGLIGVSMAHAATYSLHWICMIGIGTREIRMLASVPVQAGASR